MPHNSWQISDKSNSDGIEENAENNKSCMNTESVVLEDNVKIDPTITKLKNNSVIDKTFIRKPETTSLPKSLNTNNKTDLKEDNEEENEAYIKSIEQLLKAIEKAPYLTKGLKEILCVQNLNSSNKDDKNDEDDIENSNEAGKQIQQNPKKEKEKNKSISNYSIATTNGSDATPVTSSCEVRSYGEGEFPCVDVYLVLAPENKVIHRKYDLESSVSDIIKELSELLDIPDTLLEVSIDKVKIKVEPDSTFKSLGFEVGNIVTLQILSRDPDRYPIVTCLLGEALDVVPAVVTPFKDHSGKTKILVTELYYDQRVKKPFLGGFRHKLNSRVYHNASSQTPRPSRRIRCPINSRDTQTYQLHHMLIQTRRDTSTQMCKPYCYVSNLEDKLLVPGKYETAKEREGKIMKKIIIIQKYWRVWLAKQRTKRIRKIKKLVEMNEDEVKEMKTKIRDKLFQKYKQKRIHPKTINDFDLLYSDLEKWRLKELDKINMNFTGAARKAALCHLLDEESDYIHAIDRQKNQVFSEAKAKSYFQLLEKGAKVKQWKSEDNALHTIDTVETQRCRLLLNTYETLKMRFLNDQHRLDILLTAKKIVEEHDCALTKDLIELLQREGYMITRNMCGKVLDGLRERIATLFHIYAKTPEFNPEISQYLKYPMDELAFRGKNFKCRSCKNYLLSEEFPLSIIKFNMNYCKSCVRLNNIACKRKDFSPYSYLLDQVRRSEVEKEYGELSKAFLMNHEDTKFLVEDIWSNCSILSGCRELFDLKLTRWISTDDWSPWNNILITKDEAEAHESLSAPLEVYSPELINAIQQKHSMAKIYYARLIVQSNLLKAKYERDKLEPFQREYIRKPKTYA